MKSELGITNPDYYSYLRETGVYKVEGTDDVKEFQDTLKGKQRYHIDMK